MLKDRDFYYFRENIKTIIGYKTAETVSKKAVHKTGEFIANKIADAVTKTNDNKIVKQEPVEKIIIPLEKRDEISNDLRQVLL